MHVDISLLKVFIEIQHETLKVVLLTLYTLPMSLVDASKVVVYYFMGYSLSSSYFTIASHMSCPFVQWVY